ncbi:MAG: NPCBM/NEW2 domain-containing protein [Candidatus Spyradosoma sp.]
MKLTKIFAALCACAAGTLAHAFGGSADGGGVHASVPSTVPVEISETALLRGRQDFGETRLDASVEGNPLRIAGTAYAHGIGTHATSMIPLDVPPEGSFGGKDMRAARLLGACGIDDEAGAGGDGAEFRVLSGTEVLWSSGVMRRGEPAKRFSVEIPRHAKKLYLLALAGGNDVCDHADWADLKWESDFFGRLGAAGHSLDAREFGLVPDESGKDRTAAFRRALNAARDRLAREIVLEKGTYHFYAEEGLEVSLWISNHDQQETLRVAIPLVDQHGLKIRGNGSTFIFHGKCLPVLVMDSSRVTLEGVSLDFARPLFSEAEILGFRDGGTVVSIDRTAFPYEIRDGKIFFLGENYPRQTVNSATAFRSGTKRIVARTSDIACGNAAEALPDGNVLLRHDFSKDGEGAAPGDVLTLRSWWRPAPACVIYRAKDTTLRDVAIHASFGMALLAQRAENVSVAGTRGAEAKTSGVFPRAATGRVHSSGADATHFSNVKGRVVVENSFFETMLDDAINVHSTCLQIEEIPAPDTLRCRYRHPQAIGFEIFEPGENLRFIAGRTLENGDVVRVKSARRVSPTEAVVRLDGNVPAGVRPGDAVENADFQPEVVFRGNVVQNNRARAALFTTPKKVTAENNVFRDVAGSAILLAGDAQGWFESGACEDVVVRGNVFENCLTSRFQFTEAIVSIFPEVRDLAAQKKFYHRNVVIEGNEFRTFDVPLLFAVSTENLRFADNRVFYNRDHEGWGRRPFRFVRCRDVEIRGNAVAPAGTATPLPQPWTSADCDAEATTGLSFGE